MNVKKVTVATVVLLLVCFAVVSAPVGVDVVVFDFRLTTDTPGWKWIEKGMADRVSLAPLQIRRRRPAQRDWVRDVGERLNWDPRMMADHRSWMTVFDYPGPKYVVSGTAEVKDDTLRITADILHGDRSRQLVRKTVSGKATGAPAVIRRLVAEIVAWQKNESVDKVLSTLPESTLNLAATRALYEGVALYDRQQHAEALARFFAAAQTAPAAAEPHYWIGKAYAQMGRCRHACEAWNRFVRKAPSHPRVGDILRQYVHSLETTEPDPVTLQKRLGELERIRGVSRAQVLADAGTYHTEARHWFRRKRDALFAEMARRDPDRLRANQSAFPSTPRMLDLYHKLTGRGPTAAQLGRLLDEDYYRVSYYAPDAAEWRLPDGKPGMPLNWRRRTCLLAPDGYAFAKLRFYATPKPPEELKTYGSHGTRFTFTLSPDELSRPLGMQDRPPADFMQVFKTEDVGKAPIEFGRLPLGGMIFISGDRKVLDSLAIEAEFERLENVGSLDVDCVDTPEFMVTVNGRHGSQGPGLVGPLNAGPYQLTFHPCHPGTVFTNWSTNVTVVAGGTVRVVGKLDLRPECAVQPRAKSRMVCARYPQPVLRRDEQGSRTAALADEKTLRVVWAAGGDLWIAETHDGQRFCSPARLPGPVSSGGTERDPRFIRGHAGRTWLTFVSDRHTQGEDRPYLCWSHDLKQWSEPALVSSGLLMAYDVIQGNDNRLYRLEFRYVVNTDGYASSKSRNVIHPPAHESIHISQNQDAWLHDRSDYRGNVPDGRGLMLSVSADGRQWKPLGRMPGTLLDGFAIAPSPGAEARFRSQDANGSPKSTHVDIGFVRRSVARDLARRSVVRLFQDEQGGFEVFIKEARYKRRRSFLYHMTSNDGISWSKPRRVVGNLPALIEHFEITRDHGATFVTWYFPECHHGLCGRPVSRNGVGILLKNGYCIELKPFSGLVRWAAFAGYHKRWGCYATWMGEQTPLGSSTARRGPYILQAHITDLPELKAAAAGDRTSSAAALEPAAVAQFKRGRAAYDAGNTNAALSHFIRTAALDPRHVDALAWSGRCYHELGEYAHAVIDLETYLEVAPEGAHAAVTRERLKASQEKLAPKKRAARRRPGL